MMKNKIAIRRRVLEFMVLGITFFISFILIINAERDIVYPIL